MPAFLRHAALAIAAAFVTASLSPAPAQGKKHGDPPDATAQKCGSQIPWAKTLEAALAQAKETKRPVFWYVPTVPDSTMDRRPVIDHYMLSGPFMMPDVVSLITRRTVAYKGRPDKTQAAPYDLAVTKFIEPGFLLLAADGTLIAKVDRLTTFHELWLTALLDRALAKASPGTTPADAAAANNDSIAQAENALLDGRLALAATLVAPAAAAAAAQPDPRLAYVVGRIEARLGHADLARAALLKAATPESATELGLLALREEKWADAEAVLARVTGGKRAAEARYLRGVALAQMNRQPEAVKLWTALATEAPNEPFAWKAASEAGGHGPFTRCFEEYGYLAPDALVDAVEGTQRARTVKDIPWLTQRSVKYLAERQRPSGVWDDSNYDFGGRDTLPDVYVAVTALCAEAMLAQRTAENAGVVDVALGRAFTYLADESHATQTKNTQERIWAHAYRMEFFARLLASNPKNAEAVRHKLQEVVRSTEALQKKDGIYAHEYTNPFATATAIHGLRAAKLAGANVNEAAMKHAAEAIGATRSPGGQFAYGQGKGKDGDVMAMGRGPLCTWAMTSQGLLDPAHLPTAIEAAFKDQAAYEAVRKYDDHTPPHHIGGFFFYWDLVTRIQAIRELPDAAMRRKYLDQARDILVTLPEIDGRFMDSHELGKTYGTAMALIGLKLCEDPSPN